MGRAIRSESLAPRGTTPSSKRHGSLVAWMVLAITLVTSLAWWDEQREAEAALQDLQSEQSILAWSVAGTLRAQLNVLHGTRPTATTLTHALGSALATQIAEAHAGNDLVLLVAPPDERPLYTVAGTAVTSPVLRDGLDRGVSTLRLTRPQAAEIGLPARTSMAGLARVDAADLGQWGVIAVASAARERDREKWAMWRLVLGVLVASGLVLAFGGAALRRQRKELELQRELAVAEVQRARDEELLNAERVATMGTFAMGIAHEVATPLGVIVGRAEQLLAKVREDERSARSAQAILTEADRIQHIVRRFLDMARGGPPSLDRVDPASVVRAATDAVQHRFAKARVRLTTDIPATMPAIQCDRDLLEQAIVNLLLNACEACGEGGHVEMTARSDAEQIAFVVSDDGAGISVENARRATEPFFTTKSRGTGAGLGLAIASEIVKSHRGELTIAPNPDRGTRALIEIPIAPGGPRAELQ